MPINEQSDPVASLLQMSSLLGQGQVLMKALVEEQCDATTNLAKHWIDQVANLYGWDN